MNIRWRQKERNAPSWELPATSPLLLVRTGKIVERQAAQWIDGRKKNGGDGIGSDDHGMKSAGDGTIVERGTPQLNVQELGQEQQLTLHDHETQEAFSEHEGETQGAFSKLEEETQYLNSRRRRRRRFRDTSRSSSKRRAKRDLHRGRQV